MNVARVLQARLDQGASLLGVALSTLAQTQDPSINHLVGPEFEIFKANLLDAAKKILAARAMLEKPVEGACPRECPLVPCPPSCPAGETEGPHAE